MPAVTHLDWNDVHHFVTLVEQETLTAASEVLDVQHSTVSRRIMQLEASLGLRLFDRIGKRYLLTEDGERLYMQARELSKNIAVFQRLAREQREAVTEVAISMPPVVLRWLLSPHLSAFYAQHPSIRLLLQSSAQLSNLHERQADIALRLLRPEANDLVVRRLRPLRFGFYADASYLHRNARADWRFLTLSTQNPLSHWAQDIIGNQPITLACNDFEVIKQSTAAGLGIGFLPQDSMQPQDSLLPIAIRGEIPEIHEETLYLVMHEDVRRSQKVRAVADFLVEVLTDSSNA